MARRAGAVAGSVTVPGVRDALVAYWGRLDAHWKGQRFGACAAEAERGDEIELDAITVWMALFQAGSPFAKDYLHDNRTFRLRTGADILLEVN